jgi:mRNA interferase RelE/StbE
MSYQVLVSKKVAKQIEKIPDPDYTRIKKSILDLGIKPRPAGCKKLEGREGYRIRQGNYRIIYDIQERIKIVAILDVGNRKEIY